MVDDNPVVVARLRRRENGRMTVCLSRVSLCLCSKSLRRSRRVRSRRTHAPLSVVSEECICLTEREELFPGLRLFVHIRVELLAQLCGYRTINQPIATEKEQNKNKKVHYLFLF